ncbi:MAG: hypothetical protein Q7S36_00505 [Candidatus Liptonbacteria bacterium]|nr:hypothetical protein [Candidatus Liptonbacteria bacterium]
MKPSTQRLVSLSVALAMIFAALIIYFSLTAPAYNVADGIHAEVLARQQFVDGQKDAVEQVQKLIADFNGKGGLRNAVSMALPLKFNQSEILNEIQGLASLNKLTLTSFSVAAPVAQNLGNAKGELTSSTAIVRPIGNINFQFRLAGAYEDFKNFIGNMETNIRVYEVKSISIDPQAKVSQNFYGFDVSATTYFQNP